MMDAQPASPIVKNLGIAYDSDQPNTPRLSDNFPAEVGPLATHEQEPKAPLVKEIAKSEEGFTIKGAIPVNVVLSPRPELAAALRAAPAGETHRALLTFADIKLKPGEAMAYDVFLSPPTGVKLDHNHGSFVGTLALFGLEHAHAKRHHPGGSSDTLDITAVTRGLENADSDSIRVQIAPAPLLKESKKRANDWLGLAMRRFRSVR